jgi:uncharacterized protein (TIGR03067 family)
MRFKALVMVLAAGLLMAAEKPKKEGGKKGILEGTWSIVSATENGKEEADVKDDKVVFAGDNVTVTTKKGEHKGTFKIDPKKKTIDFTPSDGDQKGETFKGLYDLKKDKLTLCFAPPGQDRPTELKSDEGSGRILAVLKRAKAE